MESLWNHIQQLHRDLLFYVSRDEADRDRYKTHEQVTIWKEPQNWEPWLLFFLRSLHAQAKRLEKKVEQEKIVLAALPDLSLKILALTRARGRMTVQSAVELTGANRNTAKQHLQKLVGAGHLTRHGAGRGVWYGLA